MFEVKNPYLTREDAKVGDGATICMYSDRHACTIIKKTKCTITLQRDKATRLTDPIIIPGGFAGHCINNNDIEYDYEVDLNGGTDIAYWSEKNNWYAIWHGTTPVVPGRHEHYDYNF